MVTKGYTDAKAVLWGFVPQRCKVAPNEQPHV